MSTAALISNGQVVNLIVMPDSYQGTDLSIVVVPDSSPVTFGWLYDGTNFTMSSEAIQSQYQDLLSRANEKVAQYEAVGDTTNQMAWGNYLTALMSMNLTANNPPVWPTRPSV